MKLDQETGLYGPYDFMYEPFFKKTWFIVALSIFGLFLISLLSYGVYKIIKLYRDSLVTPFMRAEKALLLLLKKGTDAQNSHLFEEIVVILKKYWFETTNQDVMQCTPKEFAFLLKHYCLRSEQKTMIIEFFDALEYLLFAQQESAKNDFEQIVQQAIVLLKKIDNNKICNKK